MADNIQSWNAPVSFFNQFYFLVKVFFRDKHLDGWKGRDGGNAELSLMSLMSSDKFFFVDIFYGDRRRGKKAKENEDGKRREDEKTGKWRRELHTGVIHRASSPHRLSFLKFIKMHIGLCIVINI